MITTTAVIQIGNTDNKLTQGEWSNYIEAVDNFLKMYELHRHFYAPSPGDKPWQNACWVITVNASEVQLDAFREGLGYIVQEFKQDSIALTLKDAELIISDVLLEK